MRPASCILLILGSVAATVLAKAVQKLTLQELDGLLKNNGKIMIEWNVAACTECGRVRAEFASHGDRDNIDFVSLDYDAINPDHTDQVNTYQAIIGLKVQGTYQGVNAEGVADLIKNLASATN